MNPSKISELLLFFKHNKIRPKKNLSQNFLIDQNIVNKITDSLEVEKGEQVLEIGPGAGALTHRLLEKKVNLTVVEKDTQLALLLPHTFSNKNPTIYNEDILDFDFHKLITNNNKIKVISNLPYHISSPVLQKLAKYKNLFSSIILMVEKDYALRLIGKPNTKNYSPLTIFTSYHFKKEVLFQVSPHCFYPKPKIHSSIIRLTPIPSILPKNTENAFFAFIQKIFQKKRKMLRNTIDHDDLESILNSLGFTEKSRPAELSLSQYLKLFSLCNTSSYSSEKNSNW